MSKIGSVGLSGHKPVAAHLRVTKNLGTNHSHLSSMELGFICDLQPLKMSVLLSIDTYFFSTQVNNYD